MAPREPSPLRIFVSYRRDETSGHAGRLYDSLAAHFGPDHVFIDVDAIDLGTNFAQVIHRAVTSCDVVIALIGRAWVTATDAEGRRRLEDPDDFVRLELESALKRDVFVIPACVQGAGVPSPDVLPEALAPLAGRQGFELRDTAWHDDVKRLIRRLERLAAEKSQGAEAPAPRLRRRLRGGGRRGSSSPELRSRSRRSAGSPPRSPSSSAAGRAAEAAPHRAAGARRAGSSP